MTTTSDPAAYFGRQVRKERSARGWNLHDFGQLIAYHPAAISRVETGKRPPTEAFADQCDRVFPERDGLAGGFTVTGLGAYAESVMRGQVFETAETVTSLSLRFDTLRSSACSAPESGKLLRQAADLWSGARRPTAWKTGTA